MIGQFIIADILKKIGISNKAIIWIESIIMALLYFMLLRILFRIFSSSQSSQIITFFQVLFILIFFIVRIRYLKKYLNNK